MTKDYAKVATFEAVQNAKVRLEENGFKVVVTDSLAEAREKTLELIPEGSEVFTATSVTLSEAELDKELNESGRYVSVRKKIDAADQAKPVERRRIGSASEYIVGSVHAVTEDGQVLIASNSGSQLPGYVYGASNVIWLVGSQKIVKDMNEAMDRIENHTLPLENERAKKAYGVGSVISKLLVYRKEPASRVTIILFNEPVGY